MLVKQIVGFVFMLASALAVYVPNWLTRGSAILTGAQLAERYPERAWIRFVYPIAFMLMFFGSAFLVFFAGTNLFKNLLFSNMQFFVLGGLLGFIPLFSGIFTLITGVIPVNRRRQYLYVYDEDLTYSVGFLLIAEGFFLVAAAVIAVLFW